jgi:hypothetical protein
MGGERMQTRSWLDRLNRAFGFHEDERMRQVHGNAVRAAYITMAMVTMPFGAYLQYGWEQRGALWASLTILVASLVVLAVRRVQVGGLAVADERVTRLQHSVFFWPTIALVLGMYGYVNYHALLLGDMRGMQLLPLYVIVGLAGVLFTHVAKLTLQGNVWYWLLNTVFAFGLIIWAVRDQLTRESAPNAPTLPVIIALLLMCGYALISLLGMWRGWQDRWDA